MLPQLACLAAGEWARGRIGCAGCFFGSSQQRGRLTAGGQYCPLRGHSESAKCCQIRVILTRAAAIASCAQTRALVGVELELDRSRDTSPHASTEILRAHHHRCLDIRSPFLLPPIVPSARPLSACPPPPPASNVWQQSPAWNCAQWPAVTSPRQPSRRTDDLVKSPPPSAAPTSCHRDPPCPRLGGQRALLARPRGVRGQRQRSTAPGAARRQRARSQCRRPRPLQVPQRKGLPL